MKVVIQIPCLNEEHTLPTTLADLPRELHGIDEVVWLVIDDGSTDKTVEVARRMGVEHIVRHTGNRGLAAAFQTGLNASVQIGADIIVNTDADHQYPGSYIAALIEPIQQSVADIVIGDRQIKNVAHFPRMKKLLQHIGSAVVHFVARTDARDAPSGFRAFSREAALRINIMSGFTYTLETLIQAGKKNLIVRYIPIEINPPLRSSRLMRSMHHYVFRSTVTILQLFLLYKPLYTFTCFSLPFIVFGCFWWIRFLLFLVSGEGEPDAHVRSMILGAALLIVGFLIFAIGLLGNIMAINRRLHEETLYYLKRVALSPNEWIRSKVQRTSGRQPQTKRSTTARKNGAHRLLNR